MSTVVRAAAPGDVPELVELRMVNAVQHVTLDPRIYRIPDPEAVQRHFSPGERGLGRRMAEAAVRAAAEQGIVTRNEPAVRFSTAAGFGPRGTTPALELGG